MIYRGFSIYGCYGGLFGFLEVKLLNNLEGSKDEKHNSGANPSTRYKHEFAWVLHRTKLKINTSSTAQGGGGSFRIGNL